MFINIFIEFDKLSSMYEEKSIQARKQVAPIQCQATMWLTAFGFHVLCLGKTKSVFTGFLKSCTTNREHHNPQKSDSKWPLIWRLGPVHGHYVVHMQRCMPIGPLATLYPCGPEKFKFCPEGESGNPLM